MAWAQISPRGVYPEQRRRARRNDKIGENQNHDLISDKNKRPSNKIDGRFIFKDLWAFLLPHGLVENLIESLRYDLHRLSWVFRFDQKAFCITRFHTKFSVD